MKKIFVLMIMCLAAGGFLSAQVAKGETLYVSVKTVKLKSSTGLFASNMGTLNYGEAVTVLQVSGKFVEVRSVANSSLTGWIATSNLSAKQIVLDSTSVLSIKETALAGKGSIQIAPGSEADAEVPESE
jgi:uncharacterized protein YgiM (DUF1202 family)